MRIEVIIGYDNEERDGTVTFYHPVQGQVTFELQIFI